ncbi:MAG: hypothetical protein WC799_17045 [Desulfobacteraceae bacterium]|jgi:hypothetical protein
MLDLQNIERGIDGQGIVGKGFKNATKRTGDFAELILARIDKKDEGLRQEWRGEVKNRMGAVKKGNAKLLDFDDLTDES